LFVLSGFLVLYVGRNIILTPFQNCFFVNIFYHSNRKLFVFGALRAGALFSFLCFAANFAQIL
jgi:hypothetical protein